MTVGRTKEDVQRAKDGLRKILAPGDTVFTTLRHVSSSGMLRKVGLWAFTCEQGKPVKRYLTYWAAVATGTRFDDKTETLVIGGCGMDVGFEAVYNLGRALFPDGFGVPMYPPGTDPWKREGKSRRPKSKRSAAALARKGWKSFGRNGDPSGWDNDGGYALEHEWL